MQITKMIRWVIGLSLLAGVCSAATFGTVVPVEGAPVDVVLDSSRNLVYLVNTTLSQINVYNVAQKKLTTTITTDSSPLAAAIDPTSHYLYVAASGNDALDVIDLTAQTVVKRVTLPAQPQGVAVGSDGRVLISTSGSGTGNTQNVLLIYDPSAPATSNLSAVPITPPPPVSPTLTVTTGKQFTGIQSHLLASPDGSLIVGVNLPSTTLRIVFVYQVSSGTMLVSREIANTTGVLSISPDGTKFMCGSTLFDTATLTILAQENLANAPFLVATGTNFNTAANQGGSAFSPDGSVIYAGFNISPQTSPATSPDVSELMLNDPDNLMINMALQLPENLEGKMAVSPDGSNLYALSQSGLLVIPVGSMYSSPVAAVDSPIILLAHDQCGATASQSTAQVNVTNMGKGRLTAAPEVLQVTNAGTTGLGTGFFGGGAGGGIFGGGGGFVFPVGVTIAPGGGGAGGAGAGGAGAFGPGVVGAAATGTNATILGAAPHESTTPTSSGATFNFSYNTVNATSPGTVYSGHDWAIISPEAINIPPRIHTYQNNRNAEAAGTIVPIPVAESTTEGLQELAYDSTRQRIYMSNSGMNRVEVFDIRSQQMMSPIKVGQLPHSMAMSVDGNTLYVANTGGETISMVDLNQMQTTGRVTFPPLPLFLNQTITTPTNIAVGLSGPLILMSTAAAANGTSTATVWHIVGNQAVPFPPNSVIGTTSTGAANSLTGPVSMVATPGGEFILISAGSGNLYLYDATLDQFVQNASTTSFAGSRGLGYYGAVTAGPKGQYYVANGVVFNQSLTALNPPQTTTTTTTTTTRPIASVSAMSANAYLSYTQPIRTSATSAVTDAGQIVLTSATTGTAMSLPANTLEGPVSQASTTARATAVNPRTMAVDSTGTNAYMLTQSGLSIIPMPTSAFGGGGFPGGGGGFPGGGGGGGGFTPPAATGSTTPTPTVNSKGAVNLASYQTTVSQNGLLSIFGQNMAASGSATSTPLPTVMGGSCVTLDSTPLPLFMTSPQQINAQIPSTVTAGSHSLVVRSIANKAASASQTLTVSKYAPAVFVDPSTKQAAIMHADGSYVTPSNPTTRDEQLMMFATGLGIPTGVTLTAGTPAPPSPPAPVKGVEVYFGNPSYSNSGIIVNWAGLAPGFIGVYQINLTVPGNHMEGNALPVTVKVGGVSSPTTGPLVPTVASQ
jgi:uncharacterized protein (TIGR03437 family)